MNPIHGMHPCGACRAYVPGHCEHWAPKLSAEARKSRKRRAVVSEGVRTRRARSKEAREAMRQDLLRQLGIGRQAVPGERCTGTLLEGSPAACGDRKVHGMHTIKEEN